MMSTKKRRSLVPGDVYAVPLKSGGYVFGLVCKGNDFAFFNSRSESPVLPDALQDLPLAFRVYVAKDVPSMSGWVMIGTVELTGEYAKAAKYFRKPVGSERYYLHSGLESMPADKEDCRGLEILVIWFSMHIENRLEDSFAGREYRGIAVIKKQLNIDF